MKLWNVYDESWVEPEDVDWMFIWADSPEQAIDVYKSEAEYCHDVGRVKLIAVPVELKSSSTPKVDSPHRERRLLFLLKFQREAGYRCEDDRQCEFCEKWEMDGLYPVCPECCSCVECGCRCGK